MAHRQPTIRLRALAAAGLALALLAGGCDDRENIPSEDQRLFLSALPSQTCPVLDESFDLDESAPDSRFELVATVFGDDGQVQEGVDVLIESSVGGSLEGETDDRGQFREEAVAPARPPDFVDWTATIENGERSETQTVTGLFPSMFVSTEGETVVECGGEFSALLNVGFACLVHGLSARLVYEGFDEDGEPADNIEFLEAETLGILEFDPDSTASDPSASSLSVVPRGDGELYVDYDRTRDGYGATFDGGYVRLKFRVRGSPCAGSARLGFIENGEAIVIPAPAIGGAAGEYDLWSPPNEGDPRVGSTVSWELIEPTAP